MQIAKLDTGQLGVRRSDIGFAHEVGQARQAGQAGELLKNHVREYDPRDIHFARPEHRHLPVQDGDRPEVGVQHVTDAGVAPNQHRIRGRDVGGPIRLEPVQRSLEQLRAADVGDGELVPGLQPIEVAPQRVRFRSRLAGDIGPSDVGEEPERRLGVGNRMQFGDHLDGAVLQFALTLGRGVGEPVVAERVRHHVRRHLALDVIHQEELGAEHRTCRFKPPHPRNRDVCVLAHQPDDVELVVHPIRREHRNVLRGGRHPGNPLLFPALPIFVPAAGQDDRLRRHAVGVDAAFHGDLGCDAARHHGGQPTRYHVGQRADVSTRMHQAADIFDSRFSRHENPSFRPVITIRWVAL